MRTYHVAFRNSLPRLKLSIRISKIKGRREQEGAWIACSDPARSEISPVPCVRVEQVVDIEANCDRFAARSLKPISSTEIPLGPFSSLLRICKINILRGGV